MACAPGSSPGKTQVVIKSGRAGGQTGGQLWAGKWFRGRTEEKRSCGG